MSTRTFVPVTVKLPSIMPDGKKTKKHPLVWALENLQGDEPKSRLAEHMGVRPQTLFKWIANCRHDRNFSLPAERAVQIAAYYNLKPALFRPDVFGGTA